MRWWCRLWVPNEDEQEGCERFTINCGGYYAIDAEGNTLDANHQQDDGIDASCSEHASEALMLDLVELQAQLLAKYTEAGWGYCDAHETWEELLCDGEEGTAPWMRDGTTAANNTLLFDHNQTELAVMFQATATPVRINNGTWVAWSPIQGRYIAVTPPRPVPTTMRTALGGPD